MDAAFLDLITPPTQEPHEPFSYNLSPMAQKVWAQVGGQSLLPGGRRAPHVAVGSDLPEPAVSGFPGR